MTEGKVNRLSNAGTSKFKISAGQESQTYRDSKTKFSLLRCLSPICNPQEESWLLCTGAPWRNRKRALFSSRSMTLPSSDQLHQPTKGIYVHDIIWYVSTQNTSSETPDPVRLSDIKAKISLCSPIPSSMVPSSTFGLIWALTSITWATADFVSDLSSKGFQVLVPGSSDYTNASKACKPSPLPTRSKLYWHAVSCS